MSEAVQIKLLEQLPLILTAVAAVLGALGTAWSVVRSGKAQRAAVAAKEQALATKDEVNGGLAKMLMALEAANRAETKGARAEALAEAALQTATAPAGGAVVVPVPSRPARSTDRQPEPPKGNAP